MSRTRTQAGRPVFDRKTFSFTERLREIDRFFQGRSQVHKTMRQLARWLEEARIGYAVCGGMAVNVHGHRQTTCGDFLRRVVLGSVQSGQFVQVYAVGTGSASV